jgi:hypothetical protein
MAAKKSAAAAPAAKKAAKPAKKSPAKPAAAAAGNDSKLAKFLSEKKLDPRRVIVASHKLESLQRSDRDIILARRRAKAGGDGESAEKKAELAKQERRSGRPVTHRAIHAAMAGAPVSGPTKTRILRAVNRLLEQKKQEKVELRALF